MHNKGINGNRDIYLPQFPLKYFRSLNQKKEISISMNNLSQVFMV